MISATSPMSSDRLPVEHIVAGNYIWYSGSTSMFGWDCPAKITRVRGGVFWVMSLDDMKEQKQAYAIEPEKFSSESRTSMRAITPEEAYVYMRERLLNTRKTLAEEQREYVTRIADIEATIAKYLAELPDAT